MPAYSSVFNCGWNLWKQPRLHLLGYFQLMGSTAFGLEFLGVLLASQLQASPHLIESFQSKRIPVRILEPGIGPAPGRVLRGRHEMNPALAPFLVLGVDIFGHEENPAVAANQVVFRLVGLGGNHREIGASVREAQLRSIQDRQT